jgi:site-specific recombinase XerD
MAKKERKLPVVLSPEEVVQFFEAIQSIKYRAILMTAYAGGLRVSEVTHLRPDDIDSKRMAIRVNQGKGKKDRYVMPLIYWNYLRPIGERCAQPTGYFLVPKKAILSQRKRCVWFVLKQDLRLIWEKG